VTFIHTTSIIYKIQHRKTQQEKKKRLDRRLNPSLDSLERFTTAARSKQKLMGKNTIFFSFAKAEISLHTIL
jgi:hypothetical protein